MLSRLSKEKFGNSFIFFELSRWIPIQKNRGQAIIEFCFCMVIFVLMIYSSIMFFRWLGRDMAMRAQTYDSMLSADVSDAMRQADAFVNLESGVFGE